jgi:hypothetical protein
MGCDVEATESISEFPIPSSVAKEEEEEDEEGINFLKQ